MRGKLKQFTTGITTGYLLASLAAGPVWADVFYEHNKQPCPQYLNNNTSQDMNCLEHQMNTVCKVTQVLDQGAAFAFTGALVYTTAAAICGVACVYAPLAGACSAGSIVAGLGDQVMGVIAQSTSNEYVAQARERHGGLYTANDVGTGVAGTTSVLIPSFQNMLGVQPGSGQQGNQGGGNSNSGGDSQGGDSASCVAFAVNGVMAGWKWVNFGLFADAAGKEANKITSVDSGQNVSCDGSGMPGVGNSQQPLAESTTTPVNATNPTGHFGETLRSPIRTTSRIPDIADMIRSGALAGDTISGGGGGYTPENFGAMSSLMAEKTGISQDQLANALLEKSPEQVLGQMFPGAAGLLSDMEKNRGKYAEALGLGQPNLNRDNLYASTGGGGRGGKSKQPDLNSLIQGLFQKKGPDAKGPNSGVASLRFRGDADASGAAAHDVFHAGTNKSIFEIVSNRWQAVVVRFMREDAERQGVPFQAYQPAAATRAPAAAQAPAMNPRAASQAVSRPALRQQPARPQAPAGSMPSGPSARD